MHISNLYKNKFSDVFLFIKKDIARLYSFPLPALLLCLFFLSGCAGNVVALSYPPLQNPLSAPESSGITVCIVDFENKRAESIIGRRQNGNAILPRTPVERWLAVSLAEELRGAGYAVSMAETLPEAMSKGVQYIIIGDAEEVWLTETSFARYTGTIRTSISLLDGAGCHITRNAYNSVYSKPVLPLYGVPRTLLDEALAEIFHPAARLLSKTMQ